MNFTIERSQENGFELIRLTDQGSGTYATILPGAGALLHEFVLVSGDTHHNVIDNYTTPAELGQYLDLSYKASKLSPFAGRIPGGEWTYENTAYRFEKRFKDGSAIHGLLFNKSFNITGEFTDDTQASVSMRYHYKQDDPAYPFDYVCEVRYVLQAGNVLQLETTITNLDHRYIPVTDGWHPYFTLGGKTDDYIMQLSSAAMLEFDERLVPTGKILQEPSFQVPHRLGDREIDNCYLVTNEAGVPCCAIHNPLTGLTVSIFATDTYPYLQIFTPKHRESIALENLSGAPNSFNNGIGLIELEAGRSITLNAWYRVEATSPR